LPNKPSTQNFNQTNEIKKTTRSAANSLASRKSQDMISMSLVASNSEQIDKNRVFELSNNQIN
jgi:hypothetical protein